MAIVLVAIFSFTGIVYAKKAHKILGSEKTSATVSQDHAPQSKTVAEFPVQPSLMPEQIVATNDDVSSDPQEAPSVSPKAEAGIIETVSKAIISQVSALTTDASSRYPLHKDITTTLFWAGEEAGDDNKNISNLPSAWDEEWVKHFGGIDKPKKRNGFVPSDFTPDENPFYFALPYNDFNEDGKRKKEIATLVPWAGSSEWKGKESVLKNQWIKIIKGDKVAYAQWEDVGPFEEDDAEYVFGTAKPKSKINKYAGLDVSPAVNDYLDLGDIDTVDWQFIDASDVPDGPWKKIVTTSQINWK